ncbi:MAG: flagellin [Verrucomicrobiia bacterium]|jgi:flagellin
MIINTNTQAQVVANNLQTHTAKLNKSLARLSSGSKIVDPADDTGGLAASERLDAQVKRVSAARANIENAVSFTQTQDGYLKKVAAALERMGELAVLAQDITKNDDDRARYQAEFAQLGAFINDTATKEFNGISLFSNATLEVTIDSDANKFEMAGIDLTTTTYTDATGADISTLTSAKDALVKVKKAIDQLTTDRAVLGSSQSRLFATADQLSVLRQNLEAASSRIRDVDVAQESTEFAKENILVQSGTAMLAQANQVPQSVLRLLQ